MSLIVKIGADIRAFDREMRKLMSDVQDVTGKLQEQGQMMTTSISAPLAGVGVIAAKTGMEFEAAMSQVAATLGTTSDKIGNLTHLAEEMGAKTQFSATDAANAINYMAQAGWTTEKIMQGLPAVLNMAAAGGIDLATAADIATQTISAMGYKASDTQRVVDVFAKAASASSTSVEDMGQSVRIAAGMAHMLGIDVEELSVALGLMANAGFKGENAGELLAAGLRNLVNPSKEVAKAMEHYGVSLKLNKDGSVDLLGTMELLREKLGGLSQVQKAQAMASIFGADASKSWAAIVSASEEDFDNMTKAIFNAKGAADQMAKTMNDNTLGGFKEMQSALEGVAIEVFNHMKPALDGLFSGITKLANAFSNLSPNTQLFIVSLLGIITAVGPLLALIAAVGQGLAWLKGAFQAMGVASMGAVGVWVLIGIAIAALVLAIIIYWDEIKAYTIKVWNAISDFFVKTWESIKSMASTAWGAIKEFFVKWWDELLAFIAGPIGLLVYFIAHNWDTIKATTAAIWQAIVDFLVGLWNGIVGFVTPIFNAIVTIITTVWNVIFTVTSAVWNFIWQYLVALWTALLYFATPVFESIKNFLASVWASIQTTALTIWNTIKAFLQAVWNGIVAVANVVWNALVTYFTTVFNIYKTIIMTVWNAIKSFLTTIWNGIKSVASSVWNAIKSTIMGPVNAVKSMVINTFNSLKAGIVSIFNSVKSTALSIWNGIKSGVVSVVNGLVNGVKSAFNGMKSAVIGAWNGIKSGIRTVINGIIGMINRFINAFNAPARALNKIPGVSAPLIPNVPMLATGGTIFGSGAAIVGEAGPELITKSGSSVKVTPLSAQEKARGIGGALGRGSGVMIQVQQLVIREEADIQKVAKELNRLQERANRAQGRLAF
jgi:TP901 family phage tail tape measure protein